MRLFHILERQGRVSAPLPIAEFPEGSAKPHRGLVPPAIFPRIRPCDVVVDRSLGAANLRPVLLQAEASPRELGHDREGRAPTPRDDVQCSPQRVPPIEDRGSADDLDALEVVEWDEVEVDFFDRRLIDPHPVEKHADALRNTRHRRHLKPADREIWLGGVALLVVQSDAWQSCQILLNVWRP